jgi:uncharacterized protein (DUF1800 family)
LLTTLAETDGVDDLAAVAWLHRRAGFGLTEAALASAAVRGPVAELDRLLSPLAGPIPDDWDDRQLPIDPTNAPARRYAIDHWISRLVATRQPLAERLAWLWHGHFVSALDKVRVAKLMVDQIRLFLRAGLGAFPALVAAVAVDPGMLVYLDGRQSTAAAPNENFARELMELFTLGVGEYGEADVQAGAAALTGWRLRRGTAEAVLEPTRHDDRRQHFLGVEGVHDVATVVKAISSHPALPTFVARAMARELLGTTEADVVRPLATSFGKSALDIASLVRATLEAGLAGASRPIILGPVAWLVMAERVTGAELDPRTRLLGLRAAGQLPMLPPNVAGWPGGSAWLASATVVSRANLAAAVA